jgi:signal transduction histidine kinase
MVAYRRLRLRLAELERQHLLKRESALRQGLEQLGGTCHVSSEPGRGTTVCLRLPLRAAA